MVVEAEVQGVVFGVEHFERRMGLSSSDREERASCCEEIDGISYIDRRRNSHEGYNAFSRIKFDAANQYRWCVVDLPSTMQLAAYRSITPTVLCYNTACVESEERTVRVRPTAIRPHCEPSKEGNVRH